MGFVPHQKLNFDNSIHKDFFNLYKWSRTGLTFPVISNQKNRQGENVFPGSIIDFDAIPVKFIPTKCLEIWLSSRGVPIERNLAREEIEVKVNSRMKQYDLDALPLCCFRGGGGYVDWVTLEPADDLDGTVN